MVARFTRRELYDLVWSAPMKSVAAQFSVSDVGLSKACRRYDIPVPERGYWAKLRANKKVSQRPLPARGPGMTDEVVVGAGNRWSGGKHRSDQEIIETVPEPPVFDREIEDVIAEVRRQVGAVSSYSMRCRCAVATGTVAPAVLESSYSRPWYSSCVVLTVAPAVLESSYSAILSGDYAFHGAAVTEAPPRPKPLNDGLAAHRRIGNPLPGIGGEHVAATTSCISATSLAERNTGTFENKWAFLRQGDSRRNCAKSIVAHIKLPELADSATAIIRWNRPTPVRLLSGS